MRAGANTSELKLRRPRLLLLLPLLLTSCSPFYVLEAGWHEARILMKREPIDELLETTDTADELKEKLKLVLQARTYAESVGLTPNGSFTKYSHIDRDVLVWVLSASKKTSFSPKTWWFPIVGSIPYKGFFEKEDGLRAAKGLMKEGLDIYLRPSAAFSTLGWFDDPLLSTVVRFDAVALVDTVIHEILHNTIWIKNNARFNETLANFVGSHGAMELFESLGRLDLAEQARERFHDELLFAAFLKSVKGRLEPIYAASERMECAEDEESARIERDILAQREMVFSDARLEWQRLREQFHSAAFRRRELEINNAMILANEVYLDRLELFERLYLARGSSLAAFVETMKTIAEVLDGEEIDPYDALIEKVNELDGGPGAASGMRAAFLPGSHAATRS